MTTYCSISHNLYLLLLFTNAFLGWNVTEEVTSTVACRASVDRLLPDQANIYGQSTLTPDSTLGPLIFFRLTNAPLSLGWNSVLRLWCSGVSVPKTVTAAVTNQAIYAYDDLDQIVMYTEKATIPAITATGGSSSSSTATASVQQVVELESGALLTETQVTSVRAAYAGTLGLETKNVAVVSQALSVKKTTSTADVANDVHDIEKSAALVSVTERVNALRHHRAVVALAFAPRASVSVVSVTVQVAPNSVWVTSSDLDVQLAAQSSELATALAASTALPVLAMSAATAGSYPSSCANGVQDGSETAPDCGGPDCVACSATGSGCAADSDCLLGRCGTDGKCLAQGSVSAAAALAGAWAGAVAAAVVALVLALAAM